MTKTAKTADTIADAIQQGIAQGIKTALAMDRKPPYAGGGRGSNKIKCDYCGKPNHTEDRCWSKHPETKPEWARRRGGGGNGDR